MAFPRLSNATDVVKTGRRLARAQESEVRVVGLVQDPADRLALGSLLAAHTDGKAATVKAFGACSHEEVAQSDLVLAVVRDPAASEVVDGIGRVAQRRRHLLVVVPGASERDRDSLASLLGIRANQVVPSPAGELLPGEAAQKAVKMAGDRSLALTAAFPAFRAAAVADVISATAWQNAAVATVLGVPGADMPVLTANQVKMVLKIAAIYGEHISFERAKEVLAVIAGGLVFRTVARQALGLLPGPGWLIKGGVALSGTLAIGKAAERYFGLGPSGRAQLAVCMRRRPSAAKV